MEIFFKLDFDYFILFFIKIQIFSIFQLRNIFSVKLCLEVIILD
jgi:hypothetical protein